ncbi:MAG: TSUP family transporter, partial [Pseudobdellovibrionaceae bacterium]
MIYLIICLTSFLVSTLTLFSGFGLGTLLLPTFSIFFSIEVAVAGTAMVHLANNIFKFFLVGRKADLTTTLKFTIPAAITAALGAWLLSQMGRLQSIATYNLFSHEFQIEPIKMTIGVLIAGFSLFEFIPSLQKINVPAKYIPVGGAISGFFGGLSGLQGALRSMFLLRANLSKDQFVGTTVA